jgi:hypothetical protein
MRIIFVFGLLIMSMSCNAVTGESHNHDDHEHLVTATSTAMATSTATATSTAMTTSTATVTSTATATPVTTSTPVTTASGIPQESGLFLAGAKGRTSEETLAVRLDIWLCQEDLYVSDLTPRGSTNLRCTVSVNILEDTIIISATGIPNHDFESTNGCCATEQQELWYLPRFPSDAINQDYEYAPVRGATAFTVTGVAIYGPEDGPGGDAVAHELGLYEEDRQPIDLGVCGGHSGPGGQYHYHYDANCMHWHADTSSTNYIFEDVDSSVHSPILGFAFDGYAIYGSYGWEKNFEVKEMKSSYQLIDGATGYGGISDYVYVAELGDLDQCNGHITSTPHSVEPVYHYHSTMHNGANSHGFPYFPLCYHAIPDSRNIVHMGGTGGGRAAPSGRSMNSGNHRPGF